MSQSDHSPSAVYLFTGREVRELYRSEGEVVGVAIAGDKPDVFALEAHWADGPGDTVRQTAPTRLLHLTPDGPPAVVFEDRAIHYLADGYCSQPAVAVVRTSFVRTSGANEFVARPSAVIARRELDGTWSRREVQHPNIMHLAWDGPDLFSFDEVGDDRGVAVSMIAGADTSDTRVISIPGLNVTGVIPYYGPGGGWVIDRLVAPHPKPIDVFSLVSPRAGHLRDVTIQGKQAVGVGQSSLDGKYLSGLRENEAGYSAAVVVRVSDGAVTDYGSPGADDCYASILPDRRVAVLRREADRLALYLIDPVTRKKSELWRSPEK
ncbi:MAG TPA: hypothetical protein VGM19_04320 [Armatimonadota bacterium]